MTLSSKIEVFYGFYICSHWAFIHALLSRVPFALAGLSCLNKMTVHTIANYYFESFVTCTFTKYFTTYEV